MIFQNTFTYIIWNINPDVFTFPYIDHPLRWYGLLFAAAFLISQQFMYFIYRTEGRPLKEVDTLTVYTVVATIVGARLGHVLFYDPVYYFQNPHKIIMTWEGGLASHGGIIGILIAIFLFARRTNVSYLWALDRVSIVAAFTFSMIRLGNLMNSEMIGTPTDLPWAFVFTRVDSTPRHPAQLYEAIHYFICFVGLFWMWHKRRNKMANGFLFGWSLIILFTLRFVDEFFKINQEQFEDGMLFNMGQLLSLPFIVIGMLILIMSRGKRPEPFSPDELAVDPDKVGEESV
jgi:phosphatidylglycerol---prolipoprotein diacylglyceryl transferase